MEEIAQTPSGESIVPPLLDRTWKRILFGLFIVVAPIFNFSFVELMKPEWQDGRFTSYIYLSLLPEASWGFFILLLYAILSYLLVLWDSEQFASSLIIRLGIYGGTLLALQYSILSFIVTFSLSPLALVVVLVYGAPLILPKLYLWLRPYWDQMVKLNRFVAIAVPLILIALALFWFFYILAIFGIASPFWAFLLALQTTRWLLKHYETKFSFAKGLGIFAWLSAYGFALRLNILKMFELYNALPTEPPNCYIATAAANGHPNFVGSQAVTLANGKSMRVNRQLQNLKAVEIAWAGVSAPSHRIMRRLYDVIGKRLATYIQNPILADIAFILLIPVEWISFFVLKLIVPEIHKLSESLYR